MMGMLFVVPGMEVNFLPPEQQKQVLSPVKVWRCKNQACKTWIRDELAEGKSPGCPICHGTMVRSIKHLPELVNKFKKPKKAAPATPW